MIESELKGAMSVQGAMSRPLLFASVLWLLFCAHAHAGGVRAAPSQGTQVEPPRDIETRPRPLEKLAPSAPLAKSAPLAMLELTRFRGFLPTMKEGRIRCTKHVFRRDRLRCIVSA